MQICKYSIDLCPRWKVLIQELKRAVRNLGCHVLFRTYFSEQCRANGYRHIKSVGQKALLYDKRSLLQELGASHPDITYSRHSIKIAATFSARPYMDS